jgi:hypothetical protein
MLERMSSGMPSTRRILLRARIPSSHVTRRFELNGRPSNDKDILGINLRQTRDSIHLCSPCSSVHLLQLCGLTGRLWHHRYVELLDLFTPLRKKECRPSYES